MTKEDFIFSVGYKGVATIVDKTAKRKYHGLSTRELAEKGMYRAAFCSALYSRDDSEVDAVMEIYNSRSTIKLSSPAEMKRLFGVFGVPDTITKVLNI